MHVPWPAMPHVMARDGRSSPGLRDAAASPVLPGDFPRAPAVAFHSEIICVMMQRPPGLPSQPVCKGWSLGPEPGRYSTRKALAMVMLKSGVSEALL